MKLAGFLSLAAVTSLILAFGVLTFAPAQTKVSRPSLDRIGALANPKPVQITGSSYPVQVARTITLPMSAQIVTFPSLYTVPAGYRLVIEYVAFTISAQVRDDVAVARLRLGTSLNRNLILHDVMTLGGSRLYLGDSKVVKLYADPNTTVTLAIEREFRPPSTARVSIVGSLEPIAAPS